MEQASCQGFAEDTVASGRAVVRGRDKWGRRQAAGWWASPLLAAALGVSPPAQPRSRMQAIRAMRCKHGEYAVVHRLCGVQ